MAQEAHTGDRRQNQAAATPSEGVYGQAKEAMSGAADRASEMWDEAVDQGTRYYRDTARAVSNPDGSTFTMLLLGAALGYAIGWMAHGQQWSQGREVPDYARTRTKYGDTSRERY